VTDHDRGPAGSDESASMEPLRVLIVDDSAFMRRAVERMISESPSLNVVGSATNGQDAVALACELHPDVIVMDVNMPMMNGLEALERIMTACPTPVLMMSTLTHEGAETTVRALELGAVDFVDKTAAGTSMDIYSLAPVLRDKVLAVARAEVSPHPADASEPDPESAPAPGFPSRGLPATMASPIDVIAIGASTGGPRALTEILPVLPADLAASILVAQHMPEGFTATLAERLNERCPYPVVEAVDGEVLQRGKAYIAPGGRQMQVARTAAGLVIRVGPASASLLHHPSVDLLLESVAAEVGARAIGVVLTGMGQDGAAGLWAMKRAGARTIAESARTAVIDGMPAAARPAADLVLPLHRMASTLVELCSAGRREEGRV
jgi:two-component system, chemotaxis family, protein-glutamate methylesterase/glutaminase